MDVNDLINIKQEVGRFLDRVNDAIKRSKENKGYITNWQGKEEMIGVGDINGTKESGAVKRAALDLKNELTKITK